MHIAPSLQKQADTPSTYLMCLLAPFLLIQGKKNLLSALVFTHLLEPGKRASHHAELSLKASASYTV